jgi:hypothetical protein
METMLGISLYSYPYLNLQKHSVFLIIASVFSSTKLPGSEGIVGEREQGVGRRNGLNNMHIRISELKKENW